MKSSNMKKVAIAGNQLQAPLTREHTAFCEWQRNGGVEFEHTTKQLFCRSFLGSEKHLGKTFYTAQRCILLTVHVVFLFYMFLISIKSEYSFRCVPDNTVKVKVTLEWTLVTSTSTWSLCKVSKVYLMISKFRKLLTKTLQFL